MAIRNAQTVARLHPVGRPFWAMATVLFIFLITIIIILTDSIVHPSSSLSVYRSLGQFARRWGPARHTKCSEPRCSPPPAQARPAPQLLYQALTASRADETRPTHPDRQVRCSLREILYKIPTWRRQLNAGRLCTKNSAGRSSYAAVFLVYFAFYCGRLVSTVDFGG